MPDLSILCGYDSYMLLYMPGMRGAIDFHRKILRQRQLGRRFMTIMNPTYPGMPGEHKRKLIVIRQYKGGVMEWMMIPTMMKLGTQGHTSGNLSEEEENEEDYRDNDMTARDIINSQQIAICLDEPREAQYMAGFIALQMSRMWGMFEAGDKRAIDAPLRGAPACPYHNDLARYPNVTVLDRAGVVLPSSEEEISHSQSVRSITRPIHSLFGDQVQWAVHLLQIVECGKDPRRHQGRNEAIGQRSGRHCLQMLLSGIQLQVHILREDRAEPW